MGACEGIKMGAGKQSGRELREEGTDPGGHLIQLHPSSVFDSRTIKKVGIEKTRQRNETLEKK